MSVLAQAVYRRKREPQELGADRKLRSLEWALYFAADGRQTARELGKQLRADAAECNAAIARLLALGLIEEQELDASEYVRALAAAGDGEEKSLREFLIGAAQPVALPQRAALPQPQPVTSPQSVPPRVSLVRPARPASTPPPAFGFTPLPTPESTPKEIRSMPRSRSLSIRALMNLIESQAGSREAGQLDVYRVFVRVDTVLLKRNGIQTLRFTEDRLVSDPELEQAIVKSVKKTLGLDCPESVWVEVA